MHGAPRGTRPATLGEPEEQPLLARVPYTVLRELRNELGESIRPEAEGRFPNLPPHDRPNPPLQLAVVDPLGIHFHHSKFFY